jgi:DNA-binding MarR family transcriptional regulator
MKKNKINTNHSPLLEATSRSNLTFALEKEFISLFRKFKKDMNQLLGSDLTLHEFMFMKMLYHEKPRKISSIAQELNVTASHATAVVEKLAKKDWLERKRSSEDRRIIDVCLTAKGEEVFRYMEMVRADYLEKAYQKLTNEEIETMYLLLKKLQ